MADPISNSHKKTVAFHKMKMINALRLGRRKFVELLNNFGTHTCTYVHTFIHEYRGIFVGYEMHKLKPKTQTSNNFTFMKLFLFVFVFLFQLFHIPVAYNASA